MPTDPPLSGSLFIATGEDGFRAFSTDGRTWTHRQTAKEGEVLRAAAFGAGRCVVAGRFGGKDQFYATADGVRWEPSEHDAKYSNYVRNIVFFNHRFFAVAGESAGGGKPFMLASTDGVHWDPPRQISDEKEQRVNTLLRRFAIGNDLLIAVGDYGRKSATADGVAWKTAAGVKPADSLIDIAFGNGIFAGGGMHGLRMRSVDGLTWTDRVSGEEGEHINSMIFDGKQFVGIGQGATYLSADGQTWKRVPNQDAPTVAAFGAGVYVGALWQGRLMRSTDGVRWEETTRLPQNVEALAFGTLGKI